MSLFPEASPDHSAAALDLGFDQSFDLAAALRAVAEDLGYDSAGVYVRAATGWTLLQRHGQAQPWHEVLDPSMVEDDGLPAEFRDVRDMPGTGTRLASMGCAALALLPLPGGARLMLDSAVPPVREGWVDRVRPYVEILASLAGPAWTIDGGLRRQAESAAIDRAFAACQVHLADAGSTVERLLEAVRSALGAERLGLLTRTDSGIDVASAPNGTWPTRLPVAFDDSAWNAGGELDEAATTHVALALGLAGTAVTVASGRLDDRRQMVVATWRDGRPLSGDAMTIVARALSTALLGDGREAVTAELERERREMAFTLHDGVLQTVTGTVLELEGLGIRIERDPAEALAVLDEAKANVRAALGELRTILFKLSNGTAEGDGSTFLRSIDDVVSRWRLPARVRVEGPLSRVPDDVLSVAYAVIREALTNAAKHAGGASVTVDVTVTDRELVVAVSDRGRGFTPQEEAAARRDHHMGLTMLRSKVGEAGGRLILDSSPGRGTSVVARLPLEV